MSMNRRTFLKSSALALGALATGCKTGTGGSALASVPLRTYQLGRLSISLPAFMQPQIQEFYYEWDSATPDGKGHALGYPFTLKEQPYTNTGNAHEEWQAAIKACHEDDNVLDIHFDGDVSNLFKIPAYFLCFTGDRGKAHFYVILKERHCLLHLVGRKNYLYPDEPKKDATTDAIVHFLVDFYKKYRIGHSANKGNIFHAYYGEIIEPVFNFNERMYIEFSNNAEKDPILCWLRTSINFWGETEKDLSAWMRRVGKRGFARARMRSIQNFPGKGYETLEKQNSKYFFEFDHAGLPKSTHMPAFHMEAGNAPSVDMDTFRGMWEAILANIRPLQHENYLNALKQACDTSQQPTSTGDSS